MPPIVPIVLIIFVTSAFIAYISLTYLQKQPELPPSEERTDAELRARLEKEREQRAAAQDQFFANTLDIRAQRQHRAEMNAQTYDPATIPSSTVDVTVLRFYIIDYDAYYALVYLLPGHTPTIDTNDEAALHGRFFDYWKHSERAIWAWHGDNTLDDYTEGDLKRAAVEREKRMRGTLEVSGWRLVESISPTANMSILHLSRSLSDR